MGRRGLPLTIEYGNRGEGRGAPFRERYLPLVVLPSTSNAEAGFRESRNPFREINSPDFLAALGSGEPGRERAFSRLFQRTHAPLASYIRRYFQDPASVQDVLQDTYLAVHRGLPGFAGRCKLSTWIYSLAYRKICDKLSEKYREDDAVAVPQDRLEAMESREPWPDRILIQSQLVRMVESAAARLARKYRDVQNLRDFQGRSGEETALILAIPETLVRVRLHRARNMIVEEIRIRFPEAFRENARPVIGDGAIACNIAPRDRDP